MSVPSCLPGVEDDELHSPSCPICRAPMRYVRTFYRLFDAETDEFMCGRCALPSPKFVYAPTPA